MKNHTKIYMDFFGLGEQDTPICEWCCKARSEGVHHIQERGMGGDPKRKKDTIENLLGLCNDCHKKGDSDQATKNMMIDFGKNTKHRRIKMDRLMRMVD